MLRLRLPDEVVGEQAVLESGDQAEEVRAVPIEGPLDPVLEDAVASQPEVRSEAGREASQKEEKPSPKPSAGVAKPLGMLLAVAGGAILLLGTLAGVASGKGGSHGAVPAQGGTGGGGGRSSPSLWE